MIRRHPHRTFLRTAIGIVSVLMVSGICLECSTLVHQRRALAEAVRTASEQGPEMAQLEHLGRCISLSTPLVQGTTAECLQRAEAIEAYLSNGGYRDEARVATSIIDGSITSAGYRGGPLSARAGRQAELPRGAHALAHARVMPRAGWAAVGTVAGTLLVILSVLMLALAPLTGRRPLDTRRARVAFAVSEVLLGVLFVLGTWMA
jgi:hypothetical protein